MKRSAFFLCITFALRVVLLPYSIAYASVGDPAPQPPISGTSQSLRDSLANQIGLNKALEQPGGIVTNFLSYSLIASGFGLFVMLIWGGWEMLFGAMGSKSQEAGKERITAAVLGFVALFALYWIGQLLQLASGVNILGG